MKKLIQEWKNLDERFILESQKQQYKEAFQKYKARKGSMMETGSDQTGSPGLQHTGMDGPGKGGRKRRRKPLNEMIQAVGETLVNSGRVIPLSEETKMNQQQIKEILEKSKSKYDVMAQDVDGSAGGLAILWNTEEVIFENWISLPRILSGVCKLVGSRERILISGVYGPHLPRGRKDFLRNIQAIRSIILDNLWIVGGDFNLIRDLGEKRGGIRRQDQSMEDFNELITNLRLVNIPTTNEAKILPGLGSDHWPICLEIDIKKIKGKKPFRFEAFWLRNPDFLHKVEEWWTQSQARGQGKMHTFQLKLKEIKNRIRKWNREEFGHIMEDKQKLEKEMEDIQQQIILEGRDEERSKEEGKIICQLEERRKQEEILWRQKSRINWLQEGERNTKFFHQAMIQNRQRNQIFSIKNEVGEWDDRGEAIEQVWKEIPKIITTEQNRALMRVATMEEVEEVVMNMKKGKAPGPDGFTAEFYQAGWHFLGQDVSEAVEESRLKQRMWSGINSTFLTLIPKNNSRRKLKASDQ
eukprot:PITA_02797